MSLLRKLNDIRIGKAAIFADPFAGEKLVADAPVSPKPVPEHPKWMTQPEPGYDADWWIYRSSRGDPRTVAAIVLGLLFASFFGMAVVGGVVR